MSSLSSQVRAKLAQAAPGFDLPPPPQPLDAATKESLRAKIKILLKEKNASLIAHYYVDADIQQLAEETDGCVADSLAMAKFGRQQQADTLVVAGVRFMGESAKILSPEKTVLMPTLKAECSLDLGCPIDEFSAFCDENPERTVVVYANTSAAVKARADWVVTSSCALEIVSHLEEQGQKIIWAPDRFLGDYIQKQTGADMISWYGSCIVHEEFKADGIRTLTAIHNDAAVLVHPESPASVIELADVVGSTSQLIAAAKALPNTKLIVATDKGIFYKMQQAVPEKQLIEAPTGGQGATCKSCAHCPWMALNDLTEVARVLEAGNNEIVLDEVVRQRALLPLERMVNFKV